MMLTKTTAEAISEELKRDFADVDKIWDHMPRAAARTTQSADEFAATGKRESPPPKARGHRKPASAGMPLVRHDDGLPSPREMRKQID